jgi:CRISPR system Cascade subunit CasD
MATLLMHLAGPMQSWGTTSRFDQRDTGKEPSKSGVVGLLAAACGIDRWNWGDLEPIARLRMGVRHDRPGVPRSDYQTAGCAREDSIIKAEGSQAHNGGVVSRRFYIADATFLVGLEGPDATFLDTLLRALGNPVWPLYLGRKSYVPSGQVSIPDGVSNRLLRDALASWPWLGGRGDGDSRPKRLLCSWESSDDRGVMRLDQPLSALGERNFGARYVLSEWIELRSEGNHAIA